MKQDKLEKYIDEHRAEFDTEQVPVMLWDKINNDLDESKSRNRTLLRMMSVAAVGLVLLCMGLLVGIQLGASNPMDSSPALREFAKAESYYANQYNVKWSEFQAIEPEASTVADDLQQLDAVYAELKNELQKNPDLNTDKVIDALLENYTTKIEILETVLEKTKSKNLSNLKLNGDEFENI